MRFSLYDICWPGCAEQMGKALLAFYYYWNMLMNNNIFKFLCSACTLENRMALYVKNSLLFRMIFDFEILPKVIVIWKVSTKLTFEWSVFAFNRRDRNQFHWPYNHKIIPIFLVKYLNIRIWKMECMSILIYHSYAAKYFHSFYADDINYIEENDQNLFTYQICGWTLHTEILTKVGLDWFKRYIILLKFKRRTCLLYFHVRIFHFKRMR